MRPPVIPRCRVLREQRARRRADRAEREVARLRREAQRLHRQIHEHFAAMRDEIEAARPRTPFGLLRGALAWFETK